jgi:hypothetical protein
MKHIVVESIGAFDRIYEAIVMAERAAGRELSRAEVMATMVESQKASSLSNAEDILRVMEGMGYVSVDFVTIGGKVTCCKALPLPKLVAA